MRKQQSMNLQQPDVFGVLSATWILASNDENEIMTFKGIRHRLNLPADFDIEALINGRGELFRKGLPSSRMREWKEAMLSGKRRPSWIREIENAVVQRQTIESLTSDDIFRSQFRTEEQSPRSPIEIINWGLEHIERLRKASVESRDESIKRWQLRAVLLVSIINIFVTIIVAVIK
jgi:hypothetical protein